MPDRTSAGPHDASVQVLTAEVRTLIVGSRQVTLSVYNQLDHVPHSSITPFGRVNPKAADRSHIYVVGRRKRGRSLVRAMTPSMSDVLDREPFEWAATQVATDAFEAIRGAADDALEAFVREVALSFALLIRAGFFNLARAEDALMREARNAGLCTAERIPADIRSRIAGLNAGSAKASAGPFESRALAVIHGYEQADTEAAVTVARVRRVWSELPLIVLAGLR